MKTTNEFYNGATLLVCPKCRFEYTHLREVETHHDSKDNQLCVRLHFECEEFHRFSYNFRQHKGYTIIEEEK